MDRDDVRAVTKDPFSHLNVQGLNLHAVWNLAQLPHEAVTALHLDTGQRQRYRQLILLGHQGRALWDAVCHRGLHGSDPIDQFVTECVAAWFAGPLAGHVWVQMFPGPQPVGLQQLGRLAGWHHPSPFGVGVDTQWGSWFAYRAVLLADTDLPTTARREEPSPCVTCVSRACESACPAARSDAASGRQVITMQACLDYRKLPTSRCQDRCLARNACPVGAEHRYREEQTAYHYLQSLRAVREHY